MNKMQIFLFIIAIILFIGLVVIHEFGHFIVAKRNGVDAEEFGIGIPPRAWSKKLKSGLVFSLNWLPIGGFVKLKGEHDGDKGRGSYGSASLWAKSKIMLAGVTMNLIVGLILLTILYWVGMPVMISKDLYGHDQFSVKSNTHAIRQQVEAYYVIPGSPADKAGIKNIDTITMITGMGANPVRQIQTIEQLHKATTDFAGQWVQVGVRHGNTGEVKMIKLLSKAEVAASHGTKGNLGVSPEQLTIQRATWAAPINAIGFSGQLLWLTLQALGHAFAGLGSLIAGLVTNNHAARVAGQTQAESQVGGPVAIMNVLWNSSSLGVNFMLALIAIISLTLALMNVLPIPALDGGRLFLTLFSRGALKRPLTQKTEERIVGTGMAIVLLLIVLITIVDIKRSF